MGLTEYSWRIVARNPRGRGRRPSRGPSPRRPRLSAAATRTGWEMDLADAVGVLAVLFLAVRATARRRWTRTGREGGDRRRGPHPLEPLQAGPPPAAPWPGCGTDAGALPCSRDASEIRDRYPIRAPEDASASDARLRHRLISEPPVSQLAARLRAGGERLAGEVLGRGPVVAARGERRRRRGSSEELVHQEVDAVRDVHVSAAVGVGALVHASRTG